MKQKQYNPTLDLLRIIAILAVVGIHTTTRTLEVSHLDLNNLPFTLFLNQAMRFAVPLFFMISGFVLELTYPFYANYFMYLKKRIQRILIPYIFWSTIYHFFIYKQHTDNFLQSLLNGSASYQLYFIPSLLIFYLIFPFLHTIFYFLSNKFIFILLAALQIGILYYDYSIKPLPFYYPLNIALLNYFVFLLGMFAAKNQETVISFVKKWQVIFGIGTLALAYYIYNEGKTLYYATYNYLSFYSQWRPSVLIYAISLSGFLYCLFYKRFANSNIIKPFSRLSFFVFFVHVIILEIIWHTAGIYLHNITGGKIIYNFWYDPLFFAAVASISFLISYLAHKIPHVSRITG